MRLSCHDVCNSALAPLLIHGGRSSHPSALNLNLNLKPVSTHAPTWETLNQLQRRRSPVSIAFLSTPHVYSQRIKRPPLLHRPSHLSEACTAKK